MFELFIYARFAEKINVLKSIVYVHQQVYPFKEEAQSALFKDPVRTAL